MHIWLKISFLLVLFKIKSCVFDKEEIKYTKNGASACNTPKKLVGYSAETIAITKQSTSDKALVKTGSKNSNNNDGSGKSGNGNGNKNISRDLFSSNQYLMNDFIKSNHSKISDRNYGLVQPSVSCIDDFVNKSKVSPTMIAIHGVHNLDVIGTSTPLKNAGPVLTSTPSFSKNSSGVQQHQFSGQTPGNKSGNRSRHSNSLRSQQSPNDSRSMDNSSTFLDTSVGSARHSHEKSRDRRTCNTSTLCLGDFLTSSTTKQQAKGQKLHGSFENSPHNSSHISIEKDFPSFTPKGKTNRITLNSTPQSEATLKTNVVKPLKRVVPTRISANNNEFSCPAFRSDNNILEVQQEENDNTRDMLKSQKDIIRRVFQEEKPTETNLRAFLQEKFSTKVTQMKNTPPIDLTKITNKLMLDKFIAIYSIVLDLNLITNVLTEFSYLLNLINVDADDYYERNPHVLNSINDNLAIDSTSEQINIVDVQQRQQEANDSDCMMPLNRCGTGATDRVIDAGSIADSLLKNINNCVYFGLGVLQLQKNVLRLLDSTSIKVLLENERLTTLDATIKDDLMAVYSHKIQMELSLRTHDTSASLVKVHNTSMKVFYQQEQDTQINFPSVREFATFKKQRDTFYSILGLWESKHLNPTWDFEAELGRKVRSLLSLMDHPINMAHMAKLFTSQLILSSNFNEVTQAELQLDLPNVDPSKLNKLRQRFIAPSHSSTHFQFPGNQIFFKDFIIAAENQTTFIEQLKIIMTNELMEMNDSTYETLNLSSIDEVTSGINVHEYVVKPETLSTLSVLAKFLGLIFARPFTYEFGVNTTVDNRQIELRNKICPTIDVKEILKQSLKHHKLIVTLPWIVQFISMLDAVSLRSEYYRNVFQTLYELYIMTTELENYPKLSMRPTSLFIIRSCLGWLFDQPNVPNDYYTYRQNRKPLVSPAKTTAMLAQSELATVQIFVPKTLLWFFHENHQFVFDTNDKHCDQHTLSGVLEKFTPNTNILKNKTVTGDAENKLSSSSEDVDPSFVKFDPLLETVLNVACPFLADFRVSIMSRRNSKAVSRTGRYRHITTKIFESPAKNITSTSLPLSAEEDAQHKLVEAFLHSQSLSVRRTVEFVQERVFSAVVKDFQVLMLIPFKKTIVERISKIQTNDRQQILDELFAVYANAETALLVKWQEFVTNAALERVKKAFDALLPYETVDACKLTCINIAVQKALAKIDDWRATNLKGIEIFSKDIHADVEKVLKNTMSNQPQLENTFDIDLSQKPPWQTFDDLQYKLHVTSINPEQIRYEDIVEIVLDCKRCITQHVLPDSMYKTTGIMTLHLLLLLICNRHDLVTKQLIEKFICLWKSKQFYLFVNNYITSETQSVPLAGSESSSENNKNRCNTDSNYIFALLLSPVSVFAQQKKPRATFETLAHLITELMKNRLINFAFLNDQSTKLLRLEWDQVALDNISFVIQTVINNCKSDGYAGDNDDALFLEMLADLIRNLDDIGF